MNSKSFLTAVLVAVSFFALCFVWEMRSVLPEGGGKEIAVGACVGGLCAELFPDSCESKPEEPCVTRVKYDEPYTLPCGCIEILDVWRKGCSSSQGRTECHSKAGKRLLSDQDGDEVLDIEEGGCGDFTTFSCKRRIVGGIPVNHENCPNGHSDYPFLIEEYDCIRDFSKPIIIRSCGDYQNTKGC